MSKETFITYKGSRWMWFSLLTTLLLIVIYVFDSPIGGPSGGTVLGYTYGVISTIAIVYLMWYGIRRRSYYSKATTLKGCLSAHVWIGTFLTIIVPLHSGFSFGMNVHTLTYIVMILTIATGVWGIAMYQIIPQRLFSQRGGASIRQLVTSIDELSADIERLLNEAGRSDEFMKLVIEADVEFNPKFWNVVLGHYSLELDRERLTQSVALLDDSEREFALRLLDTAKKKRDLINRLYDEARNHFLARSWLYLHVPLSIGLIFLLIIHIFSVFFYW